MTEIKVKDFIDAITELKEKHYIWDNMDLGMAMALIMRYATKNAKKRETDG